MNSRIVKWGIEKWKLHERHYEDEISEAFDVLNAECHKPSSYLAGKPIRHIRNVLNSCPKDAGLGIDQQVLPLWANLPDEALKGLHLIIRAMLDGKCPLQALLVLIGFLGKEGGGERPIGLTAMLYRFVVRLYKGIIGSWDEKFHAHWDYAVKNHHVSELLFSGR